MSGPQFTRGPWVAHPSTRYRGDIGYAWDIATGVATWDASDMDREEGTRGAWNFPDGYTRIATTSDMGPEARANAQLCAAAPDLYAALEALLPVAEWGALMDDPSLGGGDHDIKGAQDRLARARSALARARGEVGS